MWRSVYVLFGKQGGDARGDEWEQRLEGSKGTGKARGQAEDRLVEASKGQKAQAFGSLQSLEAKFGPLKKERRGKEGRGSEAFGFEGVDQSDV